MVLHVISRMVFKLLVRILLLAVWRIRGFLQIPGIRLRGTTSVKVIHLTQHELAEDSGDFIATSLVHLAHSFTASASLFLAVYLFLHGLVKLVLVWAVLRDRLWAYPWMIAFLLAFVVYQIYQILVSFSWGFIALTLFDLFVAWLTLVEFRKRKNPARAHED